MQYFTDFGQNIAFIAVHSGERCSPWAFGCMIQRNKSLYFCDFKCLLLTLNRNVFVMTEIGRDKQANASACPWDSAIYMLE